MNGIRIMLFLCLALLSNVADACKKLDTLQVQDHCLDIHNNWMEVTLYLTKNTVGYTAPVAARTFNYLSIGMYESSIEILPNNASVTGQLSGYNRVNWNLANEKYSYEYIANFVDFKLLLYFYENMSPTSLKKVEANFKLLATKYGKGYSKKTLYKSQIYADSIAIEIINWSKTDGADKAWNRNFPKEYLAPVCDGCWVKTFPGYVSSLQPYWGQNQLMITENKTVCADIPYLEYSTDSTSAFYAQVKQIYDLYQDLPKQKENTAEYWDDAPGVSGTPVGHLFNLAQQISYVKECNLQQTLELYLKLGVSLNDAVIESWKLKYHFNLIRPITYINTYIGSRFTTAIATPPFPEFPSGHSFQSGAGSEVLKDVFTDELSFIDSTNALRRDIKGDPRMYQNFTEMSEEMSISRLYGGIHYESTLAVSLEYGRKIGINTLSMLKLRKE
ncbi:MAG: hypothetical protein ACI8Q1_002052 [Parvicella sp.]|jgi:hypothetical protein